MREREHGPSDSDSYHEEEEKRPKDVLDAVFGLAAAEKTEGDGDDRGEKQERLPVGQADREQRSHALRPRAAS